MLLHFVGLGEGFSDSGGAGQAGRVSCQLCSRQQCRSEMLSRGPVAIGSLEPGETEGIKMGKGKLRVTLPISSALSRSNLSEEPMRGNAAWTSWGCKVST